ncbi:MAG: LysM peptidoglycan-binding domain-containing protein [Anaerolineae bacterium]|nr:LysM peptidoglycan-binding domain-containing protein [Anaerolineae bacterium]
MLRNLLALSLLVLLATACTLTMRPSDEALQVQATELILTNETLPPEVIPPSTPLASLTPTRTLLPPPTFEPPTLTPYPTNTARPTETPTLNLDTALEGVHGLETPSPTATVVCRPRDDWGGRYTIQPGDVLVNIAARFNTTVQEIAEANCLRDINIISVGVELRVPGSVGGSGIECVPWEVLTPMNGTLNVSGTGSITFNWRGPRAPRNLIRIYKPDGGMFERVIELRQNETIDLGELPAGGTYRWYVYPLDQNFRQIECLEGGPWAFTKAAQPTPEPLPG